jgi:polysaccharide biosynthesis transport protein
MQNQLPSVATGTTDGALDGSGMPESSHSVPLVLQYWNIFWRQRLLVLAIMAAALVLGVLATLFATPQYRASTKLEIAREQARVTNVSGVENERAGQSLEFYSTQYELLQARTLAERVVREENLLQSERFFQSTEVDLDEASEGAGVAGRVGLPAAVQRAREGAVVRALLENISIQPIRGSALVSVSYASADPDISAQIANSWARQFIQANLDRRFESTAEARTFLEGRLEDLRRRLDTSERDLVDYAVSRGIIKIQQTEGRNGRVETVQTLTSADLQAINSQLSIAVAERVRAEANLRAFASKRDSALSLQNQALAAMRERRAEVQSQLAALLVQFEPDYPPVRALQQQVEALDRSIVGEQQRVANVNSAEFDAAQRRESGIRGKVDVLIARLAQEEKDSIRYNILQREVDTSRQLYDALLQRYKEIGVAGVGTNNISIVDAAIPPIKPSSPSLPLNLALALLGGLLASAIVVLVTESLDQGLRDPSTVQKALNVPMLGVVPDIDVDEPRNELADPKSILSEAYVTIQSNLAFTTDHGIPRFFMVTSTAEAEGKSTTAMALTTVIARSGRRVLLVDADMRLPTLDRYFGLKGRPGLSNYLSGDNDLAKMFIDTPITNVTALGAGPIPPSASELLSSERLDAFADAVRGQFDHVIFDCPPMLGLADTVLTSRVVEGVVYVAESGRGSVRGIATALARLRNAQARIFGIVLTKYSIERNGYGYGYGYGTQYRYGREGDAVGDDDSHRVGTYDARA